MDHSFPPSDLYADNLRSGPVPTNAWWENLGKVMRNEMKVYVFHNNSGITETRKDKNLQAQP